MGILVTILVLIAIVVLVGLFLIKVYNRLVELRERVRNAFSQIDVQLERRHDLIPNLVEVAKKFMAHERETLEGVVNARASATQARIEVNGDPTDLAALSKMQGAETALGGALGRLLAVSEQYPDLKSDATMMQLSEELTTTENKIAFARQAYNDSVTGYHTYKQSFPPVLLAGMFGFKDSAYLDLDDEPEKREVVEVDFE